jgi:hypothetical protein
MLARQVDQISEPIFPTIGASETAAFVIPLMGSNTIPAS